MRTNSVIMISLALMLLLSACNVPTSAPAATQPSSAESTASHTATVAQPIEAAPTQTPADNTEQGAPSKPPLLTVDVNGVAQDVTSQVVASVPPSTDGPWWEAMPQYTLLTLQGYPITNHLMQPQIFVYPVKDLESNEVAGKVAQSLQTLLQNQQVDQTLPFLPPYNAAQVMHAQEKFLDFKNGKGVRFLTEYDQAPLPINNHELIYTYQGLTSDGKYYVAAVLPVNLPGLPATENATEALPADFMDNFLKYLADTVDKLNQQPVSAYTPDLSKLDAMMQSIEIK